jgi:uncharacterized membrane protein YkoI
MKTTFKVLIVSLVCVLFALVTACSSSTATTSAGISGADDAKARATAVVPGTVQSAEQKEDEGNQVWLVKVKVQNGAVIEVYLLASGDLQELKDFVGPFDYEHTPVAGQLKYTEARAKAFALKQGAVVAWEFTREAANEFQYEFYVRDAEEKLWEIKLTGTGETKSIEEKAAVD